MAEARANVPGPKGPTIEKEVEARPNPSPGAPASNLFALTVNASTGEIVKIEKVEGAGTRRDLRDDDKAELTAKAVPTLDALIERAFEAGIASVLGVEAGHAEAEESDEEADLRRALLMPLMEGTWAKDFLKREFLGKAILASAVAHVTAARTASSDKGGAQQKPEGSAGRQP
jgi:hypothetical protein